MADLCKSQGVHSEQSIPEKKEGVSGVVIMASIISSLGGILFGYDIGIISGAMLQIREQFDLNNTMYEVVTSSVLLGAFLASLVAGSVVDYFGRRASILFTSLLFLVGTAVLAFSVDLPMILVGRLVVGFGVALSTAAECTYISEISPPRYRGMLVSLNEFGITVGFLLAYIFGFVFISHPAGWRLMFGLAAIPAIIQLLGVLVLPPSPYFLVLKGRHEEASKTIERLYQDSDPQLVIKSITEALAESKSSKFGDIFSSLDSMRYRMLIGTVLVLLQQFTGNANVLFYAPMIFQQFGYCSDRTSTLVSVSLGAVKVVTAAFALMFVDRFGRRKFLCTGSAVMGVSILALGILSSFVAPVSLSSSQRNTSVIMMASEIIVDTGPLHHKLPNSWSLDIVTFASNQSLINISVHKNHTTASGGCESHSQSLTVKAISVTALMAYICGYQFSFGIGTWLVLSEIYPTAVRGRSISIATSVNWAGNLVVTITFFTLIENIGITALFIVYAIICLLATAFIYLFVPETKQKTLEEISTVFNAGPEVSWSSSCCRRKNQFNCQYTDRTSIKHATPKFNYYQSDRSIINNGFNELS